ncbi:hypothetical protein FHG87_017323 [Trinorchestia longiramus]|nr:hypothetical protein FHG87_017323 [Trinorchestia longiramus]
MDDDIKLNVRIDPLGRSAPDLPSESELFKKVVRSSSYVTMICNAQASPVPSYNHSNYTSVDPLGRTAPDLPTEGEYVKKSVTASHPLAMICSAQASPVPSYCSPVPRRHFPSTNAISINNMTLKNRKLFVDPLGRSAPDIPIVDRLKLQQVKSFGSIALICSVQASPPPLYSVSPSGPYRPPEGVEEMQGAVGGYALNGGRILLYNIQ